MPRLVNSQSSVRRPRVSLIVRHTRELQQAGHRFNRCLYPSHVSVKVRKKRYVGQLMLVFFE